MAKNWSKSVLLFISFGLLASGTAFIQDHTDHHLKPYFQTEDFKYLPSGKFLKGVALSYDDIAADLLWIKALGYFGGHAQTDRDYTWLHHLIEITTTLDPLFEDPYEFGGIVLATEMGDVDRSTAILKRGMANVPRDHHRYWKLPFFIAFNYMYYKGDNLSAARYLEIAARFPGRPDFLPLLVSRLYANTNDPAQAIPFLEEMIRSTANPELNVKLRTRLKEVLLERDIRNLEKARDRFLMTSGRYPRSLAELVQDGYIARIPEEPFGGFYYIDAADHAIHSSVTKRLELHGIKSGPGAVITFE